MANNEGVAIVRTKLEDPPEIFGIDLLAPLKSFVNWIVEQIMSLARNVWNFIQERIIMPIVNAVKWIIDKIVGAVKDFFSSVVNAVRSMFMPTDPETVINKLPMIIGTVAIASLGTGAILTAIGTKMMGTGIEVEPLAKFMHSLFRADIVISFSIGTLLGYSIRTPLGYWARKTFRPLKPDPITLFGLYTRGYITREQLKSELAYVTGYPDKYIDGLIDIFEYNPSLFDLLRMADFVELTDEFIEESLRILGVKEKYKDIIKTLIKRRPLREEVRANVSQLITAYSKGYISRTFLSTALDNLGLQSKEKELMLMYADNKRTYEIIEERVYILRTAYQKGLIDKSTLDRELTKLGLDREWINLIISRGDLFRKIEVPIPKITRGFVTEIPFSVSYSYTLS
jgi:hypothetical protein